MSKYYPIAIQIAPEAKNTTIKDCVVVGKTEVLGKGTKFIRTKMKLTVTDTVGRTSNRGKR